MLHDGTNRLDDLKVEFCSMVYIVRKEVRILPTPIKKRRRRWTVSTYWINRPSALRIGEVLWVHPDLKEELKANPKKVYERARSRPDELGVPVSLF